MSEPGILVVGDVIDDTVVIPSGPIRPDTDTTSTIRRVAGGSAANTAAWLAALGADVSFVGAVGKADVARHAALLPGVDAHLQAVDAATGRASWSRTPSPPSRPGMPRSTIASSRERSPRLTPPTSRARR